MDGLPSKFDGSAIRRVYTGEHFDERGFSRAILAHQRMNLARGAKSVHRPPKPSPLERI